MPAMRFSRLGTSWSLLALVTTLAAIPPAAGAQNFLPLTVGNQWISAGLTGGSEIRTVTGSVSIRGREAFVIRYGPSIYNEGLENYWSTTPEGDVLLHGFDRTHDVDLVSIYDPPIVMLDAPLALDRTWTQTVTYYAAPDTSIPAGTFSITQRVFEAGVLTVPAGTFFAYGIGQFLPGAMRLSSAGTFTVTGDRILASGSPTEWWAEGIGEVKYSSDQVYVLESLTGPTAADALTWGGLKALYRR